VPEALGKGQIAFGKAFAECGTRQSTHGKKLIGKALFAECILLGTRQRKATVTAPVPLAVTLPSANPAGTRQRFFIFFKFFFLCRVPTLQALGKNFYFFKKKFFTERQPGRHSAKSFYFFF